MFDTWVFVPLFFLLYRVCFLKGMLNMVLGNNWVIYSFRIFFFHFPVTSNTRHLYSHIQLNSKNCNKDLKIPILYSIKSLDLWLIKSFTPFRFSKYIINAIFSANVNAWQTTKTMRVWAYTDIVLCIQMHIIPLENNLFSFL